MNLSREQHGHQAQQFLAFHEKRGGEWVDNFGVWAGTKDFELYDFIAIKTMVVETFASHGVVPSELGEVA
jgi:hypothetical protein